MDELYCEVCGRSDRNPDQIEFTWGPFSLGTYTVCDPGLATEDDPECDPDVPEPSASMRRAAWTGYHA